MKKTIIASAVLLGTLFAAINGFALTPQQVIDLKKAGVSDQTIQIMMKQEEAKDPFATMGTREVKDKDGNTVIIYTTGASDTSAADEEEKKNVERAWQMLNKSIIIKK